MASKENTKPAGSGVTGAMAGLHLSGSLNAGNNASGGPAALAAAQYKSGGPNTGAAGSSTAQHQSSGPPGPPPGGQRGQSKGQSGSTSAGIATNINQYTMNLEDRIMANIKASQKETFPATLSYVDDAGKPYQFTGELPCRTDFGQLGKKIQLVANYFQLDVNAFTAHHYTITSVVRLDVPSQNGKGSPKAGQELTEKAIQALLRKQFGGATGKVFTDFRSNFYSLGKGKDLVTKFIVYHEDDATRKSGGAPIKLGVTLEFQGVIAARKVCEELQSTDPTLLREDKDLLQALNILFGFHAHQHPDLWLKGNRVFDRKDVGDQRHWKQLSPTLFGLRGYFKSPRLATNHLLLNFNMRHSAFFEPVSMVQFFAEVGRDVRTNSSKLNAVTAMLRVRNSILETTQNCFGIALQSQSKANELEVDCDAAGPNDVRFMFDPAASASPLARNAGLRRGMISVAKYWQSVYNVNVGKSKLPALNIGGKQNPRFVPAEICTIVEGQTFKSLLDPQDMEELQPFSTQGPKVTFQNIRTKGFSIVGLNPSVNPLLTNFRVRVRPETIRVLGRQINPSPVSYANKKLVPVVDGAWNLKNVNVPESSAIQHYDFVFMSIIRPRQQERLDIEGTEAEEDCVNKLVNAAAKIGIKMKNGHHCTALKLPGPDDPKLERFFAQRAVGHGDAPRPDVLIIVLNNKEAKLQLYHLNKYFGDNRYGIRTVHSRGEKLKKHNNDQYCANVALKINLGTGGINHLASSDALKCLAREQCQNFGIDVTHPTGGSQFDLHSITSVTASMSLDLQRHCAIVRQNDIAGSEMVDHIDEMVTDHLAEFYKRNKRLAKYLFFYRDGVSEGQYGQAIQLEVRKIERAVQAFYKSHNLPMPGILYQIVGKRTETRMMPVQGGPTSKNGNAPVGTVVERVITRACLREFWLQAHCPIQGTTRWIHHVTIHDTIFSKLKSKEFEAIYKNNVSDLQQAYTLMLSSCCGQATRTTSIPAPVFYADKACGRARLLLKAWIETNNAFPPADQVQGIITPHDRIKGTWYFG